MDAFPILYSQAVERTAEFYKLLGFAETYRFPASGEPGYVALARDGAALGIGMPPPHLAGAVGGISGELCVYVPDVDATVAELRSRGVPVTQVPADQPWGERNAYVADPEGRPVHLAMKLPD